MARANAPITMTKLECPKCKKVSTIFRKKNKQKKQGHRKQLYCVNCKKRTRHVELRNDWRSLEEEV